MEDFGAASGHQCLNPESLSTSHQDSAHRFSCGAEPCGHGPYQCQTLESEYKDTVSAHASSEVQSRLLTLVDLHLTLLFRFRDVPLQDAACKGLALPRAHVGGYHYIYIRHFALDLVEQLLAWQKAGLCTIGLYSAIAETWAAKLAQLLLEKATGAISIS